MLQMEIVCAGNFRRQKSRGIFHTRSKLLVSSSMVTLCTIVPISALSKMGQNLILMMLHPGTAPTSIGLPRHLGHVRGVGAKVSTLGTSKSTVKGVRLEGVIGTGIASV